MSNEDNDPVVVVVNDDDDDRHHDNNKEDPATTTDKMTITTNKVNKPDDTTTTNTTTTTTTNSLPTPDDILPTRTPTLTRDGGDGGDSSNPNQNNPYNSSSLSSSSYNGRKPKWWKNLCGKASKGQKRAMKQILSEYRLPRKVYGTFLNWKEIFTTHSTTTTTSTTEEPMNNNNDDDDDDDTREIWLELGFGRGENLLAMAHRTATLQLSDEQQLQQSHQQKRQRRRRICLVGAEIYQPGIGTLCTRMLQGIQTNQYWKDYTLYEPSLDPYTIQHSAQQQLQHQQQNKVTDTSLDSHDTMTTSHDPSIPSTHSNNPDKKVGPTSTTTTTTVTSPKATPSPSSTPSSSSSSSSLYSNLRIYPGDGIKLLPYIPTGSLSVVLVTFPDPFPKDDQASFRVLQHSTLIEIHRILQPIHGRLFLATDHDGYHTWCHDLMSSRTMTMMINNEDETKEDSEIMTSLPPPATINDVDNPTVPSTGNTTTTTSTASKSCLFHLVEPCPDRMEWLPVISRYEQKGWEEGRSTKLSCWEVVSSSSTVSKERET